MRYPRPLIPAVFLSRPNRFVAVVALAGEEARVHVKNTGRCAELLVPGHRVYLLESDSPARRTAYDLVAVEKPLPGGGARLINMDSMAPNQAAGEWLAAGGIGPLTELRAEATVGDSRFDFVARTPQGRPVAVEVKGCTLEEGGVARFPDAPTLRGLKHVRGLTDLAGRGWRAVLLVVIQMKGVHVFEPNWAAQPEFGEALLEARAAGVEILAMDCRVAVGEVAIDETVPAKLERESHWLLAVSH